MIPIRRYLAALVLGAILPGAVITGVVVRRATTNSRDAAERRLLESAQVDARSLERHFNAAIATLGVLASSPALERDDLGAFHAEARRVQASQYGWYTVMLLSPDERQLVSSRLPWGSPLMTTLEPDSLRRAIQTRRPVVGPVRKAPRGGDEYLFAVRVPVVRDDRVYYVLSAILDVASLNDIVSHPATDADEWTRTILDQGGTIAVRTRGGDQFIGQSATPEFLAQIRQTPDGVSRQTTLEGNQVYAATSRTPSGWTTVVVVTESALDRAPDISTIGLLAGAAALIVGGFAAVLVITQRLTRDIESIAAVGEAVAEGGSVPPNEPRLLETARLQRSLAATVHRLEEQGRAKDEFLAILGHELRNPLAPALTAIEMMKRREPGLFTRERDILERQIHHMIRLVNDLLDVSRVLRGKIEMSRHRVDVADVLNRAIEMVQPLVTRHGHELRLDIEPQLFVDGDKQRLVQVFANLLTNAAAYTPPGGHILLSASANGGHVTIACEDDGPGIPETLRPRLFQAFMPGPRGLDRPASGLGLGLALVRVFVELHGGTVTLDTTSSSHGTRMVVSLPRASVEAAARTEASRRTPVQTPRRLLLVDDNVDAREMLRNSLGDFGHDVKEAWDGEQALAIAREWTPEVAILDIGLPGMSGYVLAERLRATNPAIRLVALTGYGQESDRDAARRVGFDHHCTKPVSIDALLACIDEVINASTS